MPSSTVRTPDPLGLLHIPIVPGKSLDLLSSKQKQHVMQSDRHPLSTANFYVDYPYKDVEALASEDEIGGYASHSVNGEDFFNSVAEYIRTGLDREQERLRERAYDLMQFRRRNEWVQEEARRIVDDDRRNLMERLQSVEHQLAASERECARLQEELTMTRARKQELERAQSRERERERYQSIQRKVDRVEKTRFSEERPTTPSMRQKRAHSTRFASVDVTGSPSSPISLHAYT